MPTVKPQGRIVKTPLHADTDWASKRFYYMVDAEPHVMGRIRALFDNGISSGGQGLYTHKPVFLPMTLAAARDLVMVMTRYPLDVEPWLIDEIENRGGEYDRILEAVANADKDPVFNISPAALQFALPLREHQVCFRNMQMKVRRMLLADKMGCGKTFSGLSLFAEPEDRPGLVVAPTHLCTQWAKEAVRLMPDIKVHVIPGFKNYPLPDADIYITSYNRLAPWQDTLITPTRKFNTVVFDEVQELRCTKTGKRSTSKIISARANLVAGLTGTPIYNYGSEIWSIMDVIAPGALGEEEDFKFEWCVGDTVREPVMLHSFMKMQGMFLRRTPEEAGLAFGKVSKNVYTLDADLDKLKEVENVAKMLAISVLSGDVNMSSESSREFDWKLRHATGVAKARPVAEFVKLLAEEGEKIVLTGWHRDVYDIWLKELASLNPVMITGTESAAQKEESKKKFMEDDKCRVLIISLRSGAGIDGLQYVCNTIVHGELDWSPHVMDQLNSRLDRDGQVKHVNAYYLTVADGADPFMTEVLNLKRSQHDGLVDGSEAAAEIFETSAGFDRDRIRNMATAYLKSIGEEIPVAVPEVGLLGEVVAALRRIRTPSNTEAEMQDAMWQVLPGLLPTAKVTREVKIGKRGRLDFLAERDSEKIAIECKIESTKRAEVYRQVRRYAEEAGISAVALYAPWSGVPSFIVDETPVVIINSAAAGF